MTLRAFAGALIAFVYNTIISSLPSRSLRHGFLRLWLGAFGEGAGVQCGCRFLNGRKIFLGPRGVINFDCLLDGRAYAIKIGSDVSIGPEAAILTLGHEPNSPDFSDRGGPVTIGDHVWIGYRAIIMPDVEIGEGAVVGAGAVVTRNVPSFAIVAGVPAKIIGERCRDLTYRLSFRPWFL